MPPAVLPSPSSVAARALYLYVNEGAAIVAGHSPAPADVIHRGLYLYVNEGKHGWPIGGEPLDQDDVLSRSLYLYVEISHDRDPSDVELRTLYLFEAYTNGEIFPWIERIVPNEQYRGGQVAIYGDGFGATVGAEGASVRLGVYDPAVSGPGLSLGVVSWTSRSPNLWPANGDGSGDPPPRTLPAIVVSIPDEADSGMLSVEETI